MRPTGLIICLYHSPHATQVDDIIAESRQAALDGTRVLITTLTKKMAEALTEYMHEAGIKVRYFTQMLIRLSGLRFCVICVLVFLMC